MSTESQRAAADRVVAALEGLDPSPRSWPDESPGGFWYLEGRHGDNDIRRIDADDLARLIAIARGTAVEYRRAPEPAEQTLADQQRAAIDQARASGYDAEPQSPAVARLRADTARDLDEHRAERAAQHPELAAEDRFDEAIDAVVRAATGDQVTADRSDARVAGLARDWPELAGALAALLDAEGHPVPAAWLSMDVRRWSP